VVISQYAAFLDGRIDEVALDRYAQAGDGSVWYLGEDVFDYRDSAVAITEGTWLAGRDGPAAMIMPGAPKVGDVFRPENVTGSSSNEDPPCARREKPERRRRRASERVRGHGTRERLHVAV